MNISCDKDVMIFRYDGQFGTSYSIGISKKNQNGGYDRGYIPCKFRKGVELASQTKINLKKAWLSFNQKNNKTYPYIFIDEYTTLDGTINQQEEITTISNEPSSMHDAYAEFANEISDDQLPF